MGMGTRIIDDDVLEEELNVRETPLGFEVFGEDGSLVSFNPPYGEESQAQAFIDGWMAAMNRVENMS